MTYEDATSRCWLEVDLDAIRANYRSALEMMQPGSRLIPVLKANAYGMNAVVVAETLKQEGATLFAVASSDEAEQLINAVPGVEVLPMGLVGEGALRRLIERRMPLTLFSMAQGERIERIAAELGIPARVHFKVDTGLHRIGLEPDEAVAQIAAFCKSGHILPCGLFTHLAIHTPETDRIQVDHLTRIRDELNAMGISIPLTHAVDSIGMVRYPKDHLDGARVGAWLYGVCPRNAPVACLSPARFKARISQIRAVKKGELIGYDDDYPLEKDSIVATLSAGYVDGTPRMGDNWQVEVRGKRADVLGIACMDQMMIDVSDIPEAREGDEVIFVGGIIGINEYADKCHLNRNEAWARIGRRVPRIFFEEGRPVRICAEV